MPRKKSKSIGVSSLLIQEEPLQVLPSLAVAIGLNEAIFLQQLHYWLRHSKNNRDGKLWVYNTFEEWQEQMPWWSSRTLMRIVDYLRKKGLIETTSKYNQAAIDKTLWYTINYNAVLKLSLPEEPDTTTCHIDDDKLSSPTCQLVLSNMPDCHDLDYDNLSQPIPETTKRLQQRLQQRLLTIHHHHYKIIMVVVVVRAFTPTAWLKS